MINKEEVKDYIKKIPPTPSSLRKAIMLVEKGKLSAAAKHVQEDKALSAYLRSIVNKPVFGFRGNITDINQIFGILGLNKTTQLLYNYLLTLLAPKKWELFHLSNSTFSDLQTQLSVYWNKVLEHLGKDDKELSIAISLVPASIVVCEHIFAKRKKDVEHLREVKNIDYNTILYRLTGISIINVCGLIAQKWELEESCIEYVSAGLGNIELADTQKLELSAWMHLTLFYVLSKPEFASAGLNDFLEFKIERVQKIYEEFMGVVEA